MVVVAAPCSVADHIGNFFRGARVSRGPTGVPRVGGMCEVYDRGTANAEGEGRGFEERAGFFSDFIRNWKKVPIPPAFS